MQNLVQVSLLLLQADTDHLRPLASNKERMREMLLLYQEICFEKYSYENSSGLKDHQCRKTFQLNTMCYPELALGSEKKKKLL